MPRAGIRDSSVFDADGRLAAHRVINGSTSVYKHPASVLRHTALTYDPSGRVLSASNPNHGIRDISESLYNGVGHLVKHVYTAHGDIGFGTPVPVQATEDMWLDAHGNIRLKWLTTDYATGSGVSGVEQTLSYSAIHSLAN